MLSVRGIGKSYGRVRALDDVSIDFSPGEVHAVVGENGAGKSTLVGILSGFVKPTSGEVTLRGETLPSGDPSACRSAGIAMVHQHFMLVQEFTVLENLALAALSDLSGILDLHELAGPALAKADELGWQLDPTVRVADLPVGAQQRVEIIKALSGNAGVVIFDEPTAVLSNTEVANLLDVLRSLRSGGATVILIAHKISEVLDVADRVSILRSGRLVASMPSAGVDEQELARLMVGSLPPEPPRSPAKAADAVLEAKDLVAHGLSAPTSFRVHSGEIVGFGGVDGNGQVELAEALAGIRDYAGKLDRPPLEAIAYIPQDRQHEGLALQMSVLENLTIGSIERLGSGMWLPPTRASQWAKEVATRYEIKAADLNDTAGSLSGGNQQKIVVGRALSGDPSLIVTMNPTRGLDVRSAAFVHEQLLGARDRGAAVVLFSTDIDELNALCDRCYYMNRGRLHDSAESALIGGTV